MSQNQKNKHKESAAGGGARSAVTGVKMGKGARRALLKNAECVDEVLDIIARAEAVERKTGGMKGEPTKAAAIWLEQTMEQAAITLGRVTRSTGGGRLAVTLQTGEEVSVPIAGTVKF